MKRYIANKISTQSRLEYSRPIPTCLLIRHDKKMLVARKVGFDLYELVDRNKILVEVLSINGFLDFLDGLIEVTDSTGKKWNYKNEPWDAQADHRKLYVFIFHFTGVAI